MKQAITNIRELLEGKEFGSLVTDTTIRAAFERHLEVLSEASRHVPEEWKGEYATVPWRQIADLGNTVRHTYHKIDLQILWTIYQEELDFLESVVDDLLEKARLEEPPAGQ